MGRPSKLTSAREQRILAVLEAGGSRRQAARVSGISAGTLSGWLRRGERVPAGRYGEFRRQVEEAESGEARLVGLPTEDDAELSRAMSFLERSGEFRATVPTYDPEPVVITLTLDDPSAGGREEP